MESVRVYVPIPCLQVRIGRFALYPTTELLNRLYHKWSLFLLQVGLPIQVHGRYGDIISHIPLAHPYQHYVSRYLLILVHLDDLSRFDIPPLPLLL